MRWIIFLGIFAAGYGVGAWRAGSAGRGLVAAASLLPTAILLLAALAALAVLLGRPNGGGDMSDLAVLSIATVGLASGLVAFAGGLFGAWFRRSGKARP